MITKLIMLVLALLAFVRYQFRARIRRVGNTSFVAIYYNTSEGRGRKVLFNFYDLIKSEK